MGNREIGENIVWRQTSKLAAGFFGSLGTCAAVAELLNDNSYVMIGKSREIPSCQSYCHSITPH